MDQYKQLVEHVINNGDKKDDRTGTGTISVFGYQMRFDLKKGFPLVTLKSTPFRLIESELLWIIKGMTNIKFLVDNNNHIWDEWADEDGNLGPVYGAQWRNRDGIDQLQEAIELIKHNPDSRRIIVDAWNPRVLPDTSLAPKENPKNGKQALPPCHMMFQFYVANGKLSCQLYQRSGDIGLGIPFNIASYSLLTFMIASICNLEVGEFIHTIGDAHIYSNQVEGLKMMLEREPLELPTLQQVNVRDKIDDFEIGDFEIIGYKAHPHIKFDVAV